MSVTPSTVSYDIIYSFDLYHDNIQFNNYDILTFIQLRNYRLLNNVGPAALYDEQYQDTWIAQAVSRNLSREVVNRLLTINRG